MGKFLVCNCLFPNVRYETDIFVVKKIQIWDYIMSIPRFMCANQSQVNILGKIINSHNSRFSVQWLFTFKIQMNWIISVSIIERYIFEIHRLCIELVILRSQIISYWFSVSVQQSRPSLKHTVSLLLLTFPNTYTNFLNVISYLNL
jgi:hypothetical protein